MRSVLAIIFFALVAIVFATEDPAYDQTVTITSTIFNTNTVTLSGKPTASAASIAENVYPTASPVYSVPSNQTSHVAATGGATVPTGTPEFTGAASVLTSSGVLVAALAAALGYVAL